MEKKAGRKSLKDKIMMVVDILFVMVLCFVVLLITMVCQNASGGADLSEGYQFDPVTLVPVIAAIVAYAVFLVKRSIRDWKEIVEIAYEEKEEKVE